MIYDEALVQVIELARKAQEGDTQLNLLKTLPNQRKFWVEWYNILVADNLIQKIEELHQEEKLKLWQFVVEETTGLNLSNKDRIDIVKSITAINYLASY